ncbi:MAG TPA: hypothetical protein VLF18_04250, partial [Tahibacter sp.]|uniref:hypothetical protein n=1 Tax=Tahibacter sp. TaxID=2056211 RepID=UPI002BE9B67E
MRAIESSAPPPVLRRASRLALLFLASLFSGNAAAAETPDHGTGRKLGPAIAAGNRVIAAGGGRSAGGGFAIHGTIGQPDANALHPASGG